MEWLLFLLWMGSGALAIFGTVQLYRRLDCEWSTSFTASTMAAIPGCLLAVQTGLRLLFDGLMGGRSFAAYSVLPAICALWLLVGPYFLLGALWAARSEGFRGPTWVRVVQIAQFVVWAMSSSFAGLMVGA